MRGRGRNKNLDNNPSKKNRGDSSCPNCERLLTRNENLRTQKNTLQTKLRLMKGKLNEWKNLIENRKQPSVEPFDDGAEVVDYGEPVPEPTKSEED